MKKNQASEERNRSLLINLAVIGFFVVMMVSFISYFNDSSPNIREVTLQNLAKQFRSSVNNAHWQWQGEGRPEIVVFVSYANELGSQDQFIETDRTPIFMSDKGWPKGELSSAGCAKLWDMVLNVPSDINGFKVYSEYYDGIKLSGKVEDSTCRYRLSTGPYFEYKVFTGQVSAVKD